MILTLAAEMARVAVDRLERHTTLYGRDLDRIERELEQQFRAMLERAIDHVA